MSRFVYDAVGQPIFVGEDVAYCSKQGRSLVIKRRHVEGINDNDTITLAPEDNSWTRKHSTKQRGQVKPHNCVRIVGVG